MNLVTWRKAETTLKSGQVVSFEVKPLSNEGVILITPHLAVFNEVATISDEADVDKQMGLMSKLAGAIKECEPIFVEHVRGIGGITVDDAPAAPEHLAWRSELWSVASSVIGELIAITFMSKGDEGNSDGQSAAPSTTAK